MAPASADLVSHKEIPSSIKPRLTAAHASRLRTLWSRGRPSCLGVMSGLDLDLIIHCYLQTVDSGMTAGAVVAVTPAGVAYLNEVRQKLIATSRPHHELGARLASHLQTQGYHTWENVEFVNPSEGGERTWGVVRPDVFACKPSLRARNAAPAIYEVKVRRADFLADLAKPEKREAYSALAEAVYYCCPAGLINADEVPAGYGLVEEGALGAFTIRRRARRQKGFCLHVNTALTLMVKRQMPI